MFQKNSQFANLLRLLPLFFEISFIKFFAFSEVVQTFGAVQVLCKHRLRGHDVLTKSYEGGEGGFI